MKFLKEMFAPPRLPLEEQIATLRECGMRLRPEFGPETLLEFYSREKFEASHYAGVAITMGGESKQSPYPPLSNNVWHMDAECIEGYGDYRRVAERMRDLSQGELPLENIRDRVDLANGDAWVEFELGGETVHWGARVQGEWIDPEILSNFCGLLAAQNGTRRYTILDLKGQACLIGCATEEELRKLRRETGLKFSWLE